MTTEYKVGDSVRVTRDMLSHAIPVGTVVQLVTKWGDVMRESYWVVEWNGTQMLISPQEFEKEEIEMTSELFKAGDFVRVVQNTSNHGIKIGAAVRLVSVRDTVHTIAPIWLTDSSVVASEVYEDDIVTVKPSELKNLGVVAGDKVILVETYSGLYPETVGKTYEVLPDNNGVTRCDEEGNGGNFTFGCSHKFILPFVAPKNAWVIAGETYTEQKNHETARDSEGNVVAWRVDVEYTETVERRVHCHVTAAGPTISHTSPSDNATLTAKIKNGMPHGVWALTLDEPQG